MKIRSKILLSIYSCILIAFFILGISIYILIEQYSLEKSHENLEIKNQLKQNIVEDFLSEMQEKLSELSQSPIYQENIQQLSKYQLNQNSRRYQDTLEQIQSNLSHFQNIYPEIQNILFVDTFGIIVYANNSQKQLGSFVDTSYGKGFFDYAQKDIFISDIRISEGDTQKQRDYIFASSPLEKGLIIIELSTDILSTNITEESGQEQSYLVDRNGVIKTSLKDPYYKKFHTYAPNEAFQGCFNTGENISKNYKDFRMESVLGVARYIERIDMCIISEVEISLVLETSRNILSILVGACIFILTMSSLVLYICIKNITSPLTYLSEKVSQVREGNKDIQIHYDQSGEIGDLAKNFEEMIQELHITDKKIQKRVDTQTAQIQLKQKEAEKLNKELIKFQEALKKASDYIAILDKDGNIVYMNQSLEKETGFLLSECIGNPTTLYWRKDEDTQKIHNIFEEIYNSHKAQTQELITTRIDGTSFISDVHISPIINKKGKVEFYTIIENDITQEKEIKKMKDEFISLVSHELRTPMTVIRGFTKLFLEKKFGDINPEQEKYLKTIHSNTEHLIDMVNDMLDIEKLNSGKMDFQYEHFNILETIEKLCEELDIMCIQKNISLNFSGKKQIIHSDKNKIEQVLINLIRNAYKFTPEGGSIDICLQKKKDSVYIKVSDTGRGIKKEDFGKIFQKFQQLDEQLNKSQKGTGLGLSICQLITESLGGEIGFTSTYKKGSTFYFTIPL